MNNGLRLGDAKRRRAGSRQHLTPQLWTDTSMTKSVAQQNDMRTDGRLSTRGRHEEWLIDEAIRDSFPASDPASTSQPGSIVQTRYAQPARRTE